MAGTRSCTNNVPGETYWFQPSQEYRTKLTFIYRDYIAISAKGLGPMYDEE